MANDKALPILFASPEQINAQLPYDAKGDLVLKVETMGGTAETTVSVAEVAPVVFSVWHFDGTPVTAENPAIDGEELVLYATGLGAVHSLSAFPPPEEILTTCAAAVEVEAGGVRITPHFAGLAPNSAGVYQVRFFLPVIDVGPQSVSLIVKREVSNGIELHVAARSASTRSSRRLRQ
jgi:uncharacterized protein (TIGR03437 family)